MGAKREFFANCKQELSDFRDSIDEFWDFYESIGDEEYFDEIEGYLVEDVVFSEMDGGNVGIKFSFDDDVDIAIDAFGSLINNEDKAEIGDEEQKEFFKKLLYLCVDKDETGSQSQETEIEDSLTDDALDDESRFKQKVSNWFNLAGDEEVEDAFLSFRNKLHEFLLKLCLIPNPTYKPIFNRHNFALNSSS